DASLEAVFYFAVALLFQARGREVGCAGFLAQLGAGEVAAALHSAEEVARGVALAAVAERVHEVAAPVYYGARRRIGRERTRTEEEELPPPDQPAPAEGKPQVVRLARAAARRQAAQVGPKVAQILVVDARERGIRKRREIMSAVRPAAIAQRADEVLLGPAPDSRLGVRCDVGTVEGAEGRLERPASGERLSVIACLGMAPDATRRLRKILPALDVALLRERHPGGA